MNFIFRLICLLFMLIFGLLAIIFSIFHAVIIAVDFSVREYGRMLKKGFLDTVAPGRCKGMEQNLKQKD